MNPFKDLYRGFTKRPIEQGDSCRWVYGNKVCSKGKVYIKPSGNAFQVNENGLSKLIALHEVEPNSVGQCTVITDINKALIFEGDVVKGLFHHGQAINGIVAFNEGAFGVVWRRGSVEEFTAFCQTCNVEWEVIGNDHDNPELYGNSGQLEGTDD